MNVFFGKCSQLYNLKNDSHLRKYDWEQERWFQSNDNNPNEILHFYVHMRNSECRRNYKISKCFLVWSNIFKLRLFKFMRSAFKDEANRVIFWLIDLFFEGLHKLLMYLSCFVWSAKLQTEDWLKFNLRFLTSQPNAKLFLFTFIQSLPILCKNGIHFLHLRVICLLYWFQYLLYFMHNVFSFKFIDS